jgi:hypothetical protein
MREIKVTFKQGVEWLTYVVKNNVSFFLLGEVIKSDLDGTSGQDAYQAVG